MKKTVQSTDAFSSSHRLSLARLRQGFFLERVERLWDHCFPYPLTPMKELLIKRPCILVQDLERALRLYRDVLGFKPGYRSQASSDSYLYRLFNLPNSAQLTFVSCDTPSTPRALALTEVRQVDPSFFQPQSRVALVTQVRSVPDTIAQVQALKLHILPPNPFKTDANIAFIEQGIQDFDGNILLIYSNQDSA